MTAFADGKIEAFVGPPELGAADNLEEVICEVVRGARSSLDIAVQELDSRTIAQAILDARRRGVSVNLFLERDYLRSELRGKPPMLPRERPGETPEQALQRIQWDADETDLVLQREAARRTCGNGDRDFAHSRDILPNTANGGMTTLARPDRPPSPGGHETDKD